MLDCWKKTLTELRDVGPLGCWTAMTRFTSWFWDLYNNPIKKSALLVNDCFQIRHWKGKQNDYQMVSRAKSNLPNTSLVLGSNKTHAALEISQWMCPRPFQDRLTIKLWPILFLFACCWGFFLYTVTPIRYWSLKNHYQYFNKN